MTAAQSTTAVILAAGQGTRMRSAVPKMMHPICGRPLVHFGVEAAIAAGCEEVVVVVGHGRREVEEYLQRAFGRRVHTAVQLEQRGTGDAARVGLAAARADGPVVIVMNGDVPLVRGEDIQAVAAKLEGSPSAQLAFAVCDLDDPRGYGRVLRDRAGGRVTEIREDRDLGTDEERAVREINAGLYAARREWLGSALDALTPNNAQGELYLTDIVAAAAEALRPIETARLPFDVLAGVNDRAQLAEVEEKMNERLLCAWRVAGATVRAGARIDAEVVLEPDSRVEAGAVLRGRTRVERGATVDVGCVLTNVVVGEGATVKPYSVATDAVIGPRAQIGPFSHLRPDTLVGEEAHVGNFVETKKTTVGARAKANHLSYLGDGEIGEGSNVGAGTIFCNYDGFQKHKTTIGKDVFVGSDSQIVAPVTIGDSAYVATGTTVTHDVPADAMAIGRVRQENKPGYASKLRGRLKAAKEARKK